jgi:hypothetical protein
MSVSRRNGLYIKRGRLREQVTEVASRIQSRFMMISKGNRNCTRTFA